MYVPAGVSFGVEVGSIVVMAFGIPVVMSISVVVIIEVVGGSFLITLHLLFAVHFSFTGFHFRLPSQDSCFDPFPFLH